MIDKSDFIKFFANLPLEDRDDICLKLNREPITWHTAYQEIKKNTELGRIIKKKLNKKNLK